MKQAKTAEDFFSGAKYGKNILLKLRSILQKSELQETLKWGIPVYTINGKNVVGIGSFKTYSGLWFFQGALLKDKRQVLVNAQIDKTKAQRQWRFTSVDEIDESLVLDYLNEAIENQKQHKEIKPERKKEIIIPPELKKALDQNPGLKSYFNQFTPGKQREFADYIASAKQEKTRNSRVEKIIPLIKKNIGLNDKYKK